MIRNTLPDPSTYKKNGDEPTENTVIFAHTTGKYFFPEHETPYLFITNYRNTGHYLLNRRHIKVSDRYFYLLNAGDTLEVTFHTPLPLQTLLIQFTEKFISESLYALTAPGEVLLENVTPPVNKVLPWPNVPFPMNKGMFQSLDRLVRWPDNLPPDILLFDLISKFVRLNDATANRLQKVPAVKRSTQQEIYTRCFLARQYMDDHLEHSPSLDLIAQEIGMNKFHFLTNFKHLYGVTPHQYLIRRKLQKAHRLLTSGKYSVSEVCCVVGFESASTFSRLFKRTFNTSPSLLVAEK